LLELTADQATTAAQTGIVGDRQLVCVQTFDVARLTTHPVVLVPGSFVAVGGRGPRGDSNESGKTSFLAATALLLGDPEWRMTGGGPAATVSLLFEPETAGVAAHTYPAARQGYVIGVFADPDRPDEAALTVWCRINATTPYFQVRYADGVHLVDGETNRARYDAVDAGWGAMPSSTQLGAHHYAERLYGDSPRCLAYVARRGKQRSAASLLQMNAGGFSPEQIGDDLIRLTGRAAAFETEAEQRQRLDEAQRTLADKQRVAEHARREEEAQLSGVNARNAARAHLADAERIWRLHFARGYLDVLQREQELAAERDDAREQVAAHEASVAEAEAELAAMSVPDQLAAQHDEAERDMRRLESEMDSAKQADIEARVGLDAVTAEVRGLEEIADGWSAPAADEVALRLADARAAVVQAQQDLGAAKTIRSEAEAHLRAVEAGTAGRAGETARLLREHGVSAAPLLDVEVSDAARAEWEPRLALYDDAVVVAPGGIDGALVAASRAPGAVLIAGEDGPLPDGVVGAPAGAAGFLTRLAALSHVLADPLRAEQPELGVVVIGDFLEPQTGHAPRLARARDNLEQAELLVSEAEATLHQVAIEVERFEGELGRARAAEELVAERRTEKRLRNRAAELLQDALSALSIQSDGSGAPTEQLADVARRRSLMQEDPERGRVPASLQEVARPLRDFLESHHDADQVIEERVSRARDQRAAELELAVEETERLASALATLQDGVEQRIRQALETISGEYDRLNRESGWYGADLHIDARRPDGPTERWRWSVTPRWKRSANGRLLPYDNQANTAQEKLATVQLVLAALLAAPNPRGRMLVLDELGDSLGVSHRREVLKEIAQTAEAKGVTVLGTCQDSVMTDAAHHCGELIYFEYPSHQEALNRPTRMFGFDESRQRVELTVESLRSGRPVV